MDCLPATLNGYPVQMAARCRDAGWWIVLVDRGADHFQRWCVASWTAELTHGWSNGYYTASLADALTAFSEVAGKGLPRPAEPEPAKEPEPSHALGIWLARAPL